MTRPSPEEALERYMQDAKANGVSFKQTSARRHFLRQLMGILRTVSQDGAGYRAATAETMRIIPEENRSDFITAVRDFYPYWNGEFAPINPPPQAAVATPIFTLPPAPPPASNDGQAEVSAIMGALSAMETDPWSRQDLASLERQLLQLRSLSRYREELGRIGLSASNIELRTRLMKLLLYTIRHENQNTEVYRQGVDKVLTLMPQQDKWHIFVSLAREFFYFLANSPEANSKLQKQIDEHEMRGLLG